MSVNFLCFPSDVANASIGISFCRWYSRINLSGTNHCERTERFGAATNECREAFITTRGAQRANYVAMHCARTSRANISVSLHSPENESQCSHWGWKPDHIAMRLHNKKKKRRTERNHKPKFPFFVLFLSQSLSLSLYLDVSFTSAHNPMRVNLRTHLFCHILRRRCHNIFYANKKLVQRRKWTTNSSPTERAHNNGFCWIIENNKGTICTASV